MVSSNDVQRLFLQAVLSRRALSQKLALKIWEKCIDAVKAANDTLDIPFSNDRNSWDNFISKINDSLNPLNLELAQMHDEFTGKEICVLVNRKGDEIAQLATDYSAVEITYFKAIVSINKLWYCSCPRTVMLFAMFQVEQIMLAPNESYTVSSLAALREVNALKANMTKAQAEVVLNSFVVKGWLVKSKRGRYSLSTRTLIELQPYLRTTYPDQIMECTLCMEMVTRGIACYTAQCKTRMHTHCFTSYMRRNQACPACKQNWSTGNKKLKHVGEAAFKEGQDQDGRRIRRRSTPESDEGEEDGMEVGQSQPSQHTRTQSKRKGKKKAIQDDSMDVDEEQATPPPRTQKRRGRR
ncbi:hypothetical protein AcW1_005769 [Taiwanofungus camphoratus]|nr:hypothetical protein AcW2_004531 [Antrodia cinnamomea]KAI0957352.1 hypothetical protein AcW1_005769 [Antrodia cinnamomea]